MDAWLFPRADGGFILLNTVLLHAMRRRSAWQTRCCIAGTAAFALVTITLLALFIIHKVLDDNEPGADDGDDDESTSFSTVASWTLRGVLVAFYAAMAHSCASAPALPSLTLRRPSITRACTARTTTLTQKLAPLRCQLSDTSVRLRGACADRCDAVERLRRQPGDRRAS